MREVRASWQRLLFFFVCIAVGVASIVVIRSVIQSVRRGMTQESRALTGGEWATVPELLAARARATPDASFLIKGKRRWSYHESWTESLRFAGFLVAHGLAGRRVASFLPKSPELLWAWFGCNSAGGSFVALNHAQRGELLTDLAVGVKASVLVTDRDSFALLPPGAQAAAVLLPYFESPKMLLPWLWQGMAAAYIAIGRPSLPDADMVAMWRNSTVPGWQDLLERGIAEKDEHAVKLIYSSLYLGRLTGDRIFRWLAARETGVLRSASKPAWQAA